MSTAAAEMLGLGDARAAAWEGFRAGFAPDPMQNVWEWANEFRVLTTDEGAAEAGSYRIERTPYLIDIAEDLSPRSPVREVAFMKPVQIGASELANNLIGHTIHRSPGPIIMIQPSDVLAKRYSNSRIAPMIATTPALSSRVSDHKTAGKGSSDTVSLKRFPGGSLILAGANAPGPLRSQPCRILIGDERDGYAASAGEEGDPWMIAKKRTTTYRRTRKLLELSTPFLKGTSQIEAAFLKADQRRYFVPCPRCGAEQILYFRHEKTGRFGLTWDKGDPTSVRYTCEHCEKGFEEYHKSTILAAGEWRPTAPQNIRRDRKSYHINGLYSPLGWMTWVEIVEEWLEAQHSSLKRRQFVNTVLAQTFQEGGAPPPWEDLYNRRRTDYAVGTVPKGPLVLTAFCDVQADRLEVEVVGWGRDLRSWAIEHRVLLGSIDDITKGAWLELDKMLAETWPTDWEGSEETVLRLPIRMLGIDSGYETSTVYSFARMKGATRVMATKGIAHHAAPLGLPKIVEVTHRGKKLRKGGKFWPIGTDVVKGQLYAWLRNKPPKDGDETPPGWCEFPQLDEEYFQQLTAEQLTMRRDKRGFPVYAWAKVRERNEVLDCRVGNIAVSHRLHLNRYTPEDWDALEADLLGTTPKQPAKAPRPKAQGSLLDRWRGHRQT